MSLAKGKVPTGHPITPPSGAVPPPSDLGLTAPTPGMMPPWAFPYGLNMAPQAYASSISTSMSAYEELLGHHLHSTLDLVASTPAFEYLDSTETPSTKLHAITSHHYDFTNRQPHMHPSYYYFGAPDSDSADDSYDPTRECFQIDGAIASDSEAEAAAGGGNATPPHVAHLGACDRPQPFEAYQGAQLA
jgi:hypothetical protein